MYIHKNGIMLKKIEKEDLELLKNLKNESWFGTHNTVFLNDNDQLKWFDSLDTFNKNIFFIAYDTKINKKIGVYKIQNIDWINRKYDSAHDVFKEYRGNGYSKPILEAGIDLGFEILNMHRIDTEVLENNIASYKSAIYVGFIPEGLKRKAIFKCGDYLDSICLGILVTDWVNLDRVKKYDGICNISYTPKNLNYENRN